MAKEKFLFAFFSFFFFSSLPGWGEKKEISLLLEGLRDRGKVEFDSGWVTTFLPHQAGRIVARGSAGYYKIKIPLKIILSWEGKPKRGKTFPLRLKIETRKGKGEFSESAGLQVEYFSGVRHPTFSPEGISWGGITQIFDLGFDLHYYLKDKGNFPPEIGKTFTTGDGVKILNLPPLAAVDFLENALSNLINFSPQVVAKVKIKLREVEGKLSLLTVNQKGARIEDYATFGDGSTEKSIRWRKEEEKTLEIKLKKNAPSPSSIKLILSGLKLRYTKEHTMRGQLFEGQPLLGKLEEFFKREIGVGVGEKEESLRGGSLLLKEFPLGTSLDLYIRPEDVVISPPHPIAKRVGYPSPFTLWVTIHNGGEKESGRFNLNLKRTSGWPKNLYLWREKEERPEAVSFLTKEVESIPPHGSKTLSFSLSANYAKKETFLLEIWGTQEGEKYKKNNSCSFSIDFLQKPDYWVSIWEKEKDYEVGKEAEFRVIINNKGYSAASLSAIFLVDGILVERLKPQKSGGISWPVSWTPQKRGEHLITARVICREDVNKKDNLKSIKVKVSPSPRVGEVYGWVKREGFGTPLKGVEVIVFPHFRKLTDVRGFYEIKDISPGKKLILCRAKEKEEEYITQKKEVLIEEGKRKEVSFTLPTVKRAEFFLKSEDIYSSPPEPVAGKEASLIARVHNRGLRKGEKVKVEFFEVFKEKEKKIGETRIKEIPAKDSKEARIKWTPPLEGEWKIRVKVNSDLYNEEYSYQDNQAERTVKVKSRVALPDLLFLSLSFSKEKPLVGSEIEIRGRIKNEGEESISGYRVNFYLNGKLLKSLLQEKELEGGKEETVKIKWRGEREGTYTIRAQVEPPQGIEERKKDNNTISRTFTFYPVPDIYLRRISLYPWREGRRKVLFLGEEALPVRGEKIGIRVEVGNFGLDVPTEEVEVKVFYREEKGALPRGKMKISPLFPREKVFREKFLPKEGGEGIKIGEALISSLPPGRGQRIFIPWIPEKAGKGTLKVKIDYKDPSLGFREKNRKNNKGERSLVVYRGESKPDLYISPSDLRLKTMVISPLREENFPLRFYNLGRGEAEGFEVSILINGREKYRYGGITLAGHKSYGIKDIGKWLPRSSGTYEIKIKLDPENRIGEIDEENNEAVIIFQVKRGKGRPTPSVIYPQPSLPSRPRVR